MPGKPPLTDVILGINVTALAVEQPAGSPVNIIDSSLPFDVIVTFQVSGIARFLPVAYRVNYYYESIGPGGEGTFNPPGNTGLLSAVPVTGATSTYAGPQTRFTVPSNTLTPDRTWKLAATLDIPAFAGRDGYVEGPVIGTGP